MSTPAGTPPLDRKALIDLGFIEARAKVLDIAAFLDRLDRAGGDATPDFRVEAIRAALRIALETSPARAERILKSWSDPTTEPAARADGKAARGVHPTPKT
ncbi:MAG: hypothetical protein K8R92_06355 [Planctomycetes bacterium]|nr:hypothetical protein [Planctomycetota bacterium]